MTVNTLSRSWKYAHIWDVWLGNLCVQVTWNHNKMLFDGRKFLCDFYWVKGGSA